MQYESSCQAWFLSGRLYSSIKKVDKNISSHMTNPLKTGSVAITTQHKRSPNWDLSMFELRLTYLLFSPN